MQNLTKASGELFRRQPDECFESLTALSEHCRKALESLQTHWPGLTVFVDDPKIPAILGAGP